MEYLQIISVLETRFVSSAQVFVFVGVRYAPEKNIITGKYGEFTQICVCHNCQYRFQFH